MNWNLSCLCKQFGVYLGIVGFLFDGSLFVVYELSEFPIIQFSIGPCVSTTYIVVIMLVLLY